MTRRDLPELVLEGPFWTARATLQGEDGDPAAVRELFVRPTDPDAGPRRWLPGSLRLRCVVHAVDLLGSRYSFRGRPGGAARRSHIVAGVQGGPEAWDRALARNQLPPLTCLMGEVDIADFLPTAVPEDAVRNVVHLGRLYEDLQLAAPTPGKRSTLRVSASGLAITGALQPPWIKAGTLESELALVQRDGGYRLRVDLDDGPTRSLWAASWLEVQRELVKAPLTWAGLSIPDPPPGLGFEWTVQVEDGLRRRADTLRVMFDHGEVQLHDVGDGTGSGRRIASVPVNSLEVAREAGALVVRLERLPPDTPGGLAPAAAGQGTLTYTADAHGESIALSGLDLAFDPITEPQRLRELAGPTLPRLERVRASGAAGDEREAKPEPWRPVEPPFVDAFSPLHDGWLQLPVANLTEAGLGAVFRERVPAGTTELLQGSVLYENRTRGVAPRTEQPWSVAVVGAQALRAEFLLGPGAPWVTAKSTVTLVGPDLRASGLLWLSTERPTTQDALPPLDDWTAGLADVHLRPRSTLAYPPYTYFRVDLTFERVAEPGAERGRLTKLELQCCVNDAAATRLDEVGLLPRRALAAFPVLAWRRHPSQPLVQTLPLTQTARPAHQPCRSRQLFPFQVEAAAGDPLLFGLRAAGADRWPELDLATKERLVVAKALAEACGSTGDLALASLFLPGLTFEAGTAETIGVARDDALAGVLPQLRFDLPVLDEVFALARLTRASDPSSPAGGATGETPAPLVRDLHRSYWRALANLARLAAADRVRALEPGAGEDLLVSSLVEPEVWRLSATLEERGANARLKLTDASRRDAQGRPMDLTLLGPTALRGISGSFAVVAGGLQLVSRELEAPGGDVDHVAVLAGSAGQRRSADAGLVDQRGLGRSTTELGDPFFLETSVLDGGVALLLASTPTSISFDVPGATGAPTTWAFWVRGLPLTEAGATLSFNAGRDEAFDANDPDASGRARNVRRGHEWRLGEGSSRKPALSLCGLHVFPLGLEQLTYDAGQSRLELTISARLQLPLGSRVVERKDDDNVVLLHLRAQRREQHIAGELVRVTLAGERARSWPLEDPDTGGAEVPVLRWSNIAYRDGALVLRALELTFTALGRSRTIPLEELRFDGRRSIVASWIDRTTASNRLSRVLVRLRPRDGEHAVSCSVRLTLGTRERALLTTVSRDVLGRCRGDLAHDADTGTWTLTDPSIGTAVDPGVDGQWIDVADDDGTWCRFEVHTRSPDVLTLVRDPGEQPAPPTPREGRRYRVAPRARLFGQRVRVTGPREPLEDDVLHLQWISPAESPAVQLFPGLPLTSDGQGVAACSFADKGEVELALTSGYVEALFACRGGTPWLGAPGAVSAAAAEASACDLHLGFVSALSTGEVWQDRFLFNGTLEVRNLVSWPYDAVSDDVRVFRARAQADGRDDLRHTIRVVFDQHELPGELVVVEPLATTKNLLTLREDKVWQPLAVVEHELVRARTGVTPVEPQLRWTVVQEVRLCRPRQFAELLREANHPDHASLDPRTLDLRHADAVRRWTALRAVGSAVDGYFRDGLREPLIRRLEELANQPFLLVEASAPYFVRVTALELSSDGPPNGGPIDPTARGFKLLQVLPSGIHEAAATQPADFAASGPRSGWVLLDLPFVGRLQGDGRGTLHLDPLEELSKAGRPRDLPLLLALTHRGPDRQTLEYRLDDFERPSFDPILDPRSVETIWSRFLDAPPDADQRAVHSVMAAHPARAGLLARPRALGRAFQAALDAAGDGAEPTTERPIWRDGAQPTSEPPVWRDDALLVFQSGVTRPAGAPPYGWIATGYRLLRWIQRSVSGFTPGIRPAATLVPPAKQGGSIACVVSPFLTTRLRPLQPDPGRSEPLVTVAELLVRGTGPGVQDIVPAASQVFDTRRREGERALALLSPRDWAREVHGRLFPDSPVAILRLREVRHATTTDAPSEATTDLVTTYTLATAEGGRPRISGLPAPTPLRAPSAVLRRREGQLGREVPPAPGVVAPAFEVAAPLVTQVRPIHVGGDGAPPTSPESGRWIAGLSALDLEVRYTPGAAGVVDEPQGDGPHRLWWQALASKVQFRPGAAGFPPLFRADPLPALLPAPPDVTFPLRSDLTEPDPPESRSEASPPDVVAPAHAREPLRGVLPGQVRLMLTGSRPGVFVALRAKLYTQRFAAADAAGAPGPDVDRGATLSSDSVPVQVRTPRPVSLPPNDPDHPDLALQPWVGPASPTENLSATRQPLDTAFFAADTALPPTDSPRPDRSADRTVTAALIAPHAGVIDTSWTGRVEVRFAEVYPEVPGSVDPIPISLQLVVGKTSVSLEATLWKGRTVTFLPAAAATRWTAEASTTTQLVAPKLAETFRRPEDLTQAFVSLGDSRHRVTAYDPTRGALTITPAAQPFGAGAVEFGLVHAGSVLPRTELDRLHEVVRRSGEGTFRLVVRSSHGEDAQRQELSFPIRWASADRLPLPLAPTFVLFQDPEYDRRLTSEAAQATKTVARQDAPSIELMLSLDRRQYNPASPLSLRFDARVVKPRTTKDGAAADARNDTSASPTVATLEFTRIDQAGNRHVHPRALTATRGETTAVELGTLLFGHDGTSLTPGDTLAVRARTRVAADQAEEDLEVRVTIVAAPVVPPPQAAYALLRSDGPDGEVLEVASFAWSPAPDRIDLVNDRDLEVGVVRRRAVFKLVDVARTGPAHYAVQKVAENGATHFPGLNAVEDVSTSW